MTEKEGLEGRVILFGSFANNNMALSLSPVSREEDDDYTYVAGSDDDADVSEVTLSQTTLDLWSG